MRAPPWGGAEPGRGARGEVYRRLRATDWGEAGSPVPSRFVRDPQVGRESILTASQVGT